MALTTRPYAVGDVVRVSPVAPVEYKGRTGIVTELLIDEKLVAVTTGDRAGPSSDEYVFVDWGSEFRDSHHAAFADAPSPAMSFSLSKWPMLPTIAPSFIFAMCSAVMMSRFPVVVIKMSA